VTIRANARRECDCCTIVRRGVGGRKHGMSVLRRWYFASSFLALARSQVPGRETHGECVSGMHDRRLVEAIRNDRFGLVFVRYELDSLEYSDLARSVRKAQGNIESRVSFVHGRRRRVSFGQ
jgi:hypothetical protein